MKKEDKIGFLIIISITIYSFTSLYYLSIIETLLTGIAMVILSYALSGGNE